MTGLRQGELLGLRWRDVDWLAGEVRVRALRPRRVQHDQVGACRGRCRSPIGSAASSRAFQRSAYRPTTTSCSATRTPASRSTAPRSQAVQGRAQARRASARSASTTCATPSGRDGGAGVPMRTLQEWMGHRDFKTTMIYTDYAPAERGERDLIAPRASGARGPIWGPN